MNTVTLARTSLAALSTAMLIAAASPAWAQAQAQTKPAELGTVTVTDTAIDEQEAETSYKVSRSISATRTDTPLIDVPQSVTVVPVKQILDQAANSIGDAIRYVPGVFSSQGEGNRETLSFRGNSTTGDFFVDGIRDDVQTYRDLYNIERLEVFKGPNAMIFGRGGIGGLINRVTKVADGRQHIGGRLEAGSFDHYRGQVDVGAPVSEMLSLRLTGVYQNSGSYRDGVDYERWGLNPTATLALGPDTTISVGYEHFEDDRVADRGVSSYLGQPLRTRRGEFFGDPDNSPTWTDTDAGTLFVEHRFSDDVVIRNRTRYAEYDKFYRNVFPGAVNTAAQVNPAGLPAGTYAPGTIVAIQAYDNATQRQNLFNQTDFNATFTTGAIEHTLLIGAEFGRQETDNLRLEGFFPTATNAQGVQTIFATIGAPRIRRPDVLWRPIASSGDNHSVAKVAAGYIQDQIALSPVFDVVVGIRYEHFDTHVRDQRTVGFPVNQQRGFDVTNNLWSPRAGLIFKPIEQASIYAAYSRTYLPRGGDQLAGLNLTNQSLAPEKYENYEIGAKWDILPTFNVAGAVFQLDRSNVLALSDPNNPSSPTIPIGRQRTKGVELSAQGEITDQLSVIGSYTYSDAKFLDSQSGTVLRGNRVANVPKHAAALWTRFDPTEALGAAVGVIRQGRRFAATDNLVSMPGYTRVDGAIYYRLSPQLDLQLNVENIFNERYFLYSNSNTNITPGSPTAFRVGVNARF
ncbi:TonB-dependent receptor [Sphingomonas pituitosa]|uniref:TonB-dependent receptor n=1 Tax=Sphingomonas pituitosa TaxID=99597 RepID=UPI00082F3515|nr:TonB-dependent siderophore receptor [Sphingomonas pituitosa]